MHKLDPHTIGTAAQAVIDSYLALPFGARPSCPYFNNRRTKRRASLRVAIGKGTPKEIVEECAINAKFARVDIENIPQEGLKKFLVENDLGIDCSGFAYHVLDAFARERTGKKITHFVKPIRKGITGSIISRLRPAENTGVATFAHEKNSRAISVGEAQAGDIIVFLGTGRDHTYNHVLVITKVKHEPLDTHIEYAHSYAWPSDGLYNTGVRTGEIVGCGNNLLIGTWKENGKSSDENFTLVSARNAKEVSVRRFRFNSL